MGTFIDLTGQKFNRLTVISRLPNKGRRTVWQCLCDCGSTIDVVADRLKSQNTKSCGCLKIENSTKHGLCKSNKRLYGIWIGMKDRCHNPNNKAYRFYGAIGIYVCDAWRYDFEAFFNYVGSDPGPEYSIDRIDGTKGYEPGNVRWATQEEQFQNKKNKHMLTHNGKTQHIQAWARDLSISPNTIHKRLKNGWPIEKILTTPPAETERCITYNGETKNLADWAKVVGITPVALRYRLNHGWSLEKALTTPATR